MYKYKIYINISIFYWFHFSREPRLTMRLQGKLNSKPPEERWETQTGKLGKKEVANLKTLSERLIHF